MPGARASAAFPVEAAGGRLGFPREVRRSAAKTGLTYQPRQRKEVIKMGFLRYQHVSIILLLIALAGCTQQQNTQELKEKTAQATAEAKRDAQAVAAGIREGWSRDKPLDLNTATREQLLSLPGVTAAEATRVIAGRPYNDPGEVVTLFRPHTRAEVQARTENSR